MYPRDIFLPQDGSSSYIKTRTVQYLCPQGSRAWSGLPADVINRLRLIKIDFVFDKAPQEKIQWG
nr:unnamed protein product [Callosobruchus chinensis]